MRSGWKTRYRVVLHLPLSVRAALLPTGRMPHERFRGFAAYCAAFASLTLANDLTTCGHDEIKNNRRLWRAFS